MHAAQKQGVSHISCRINSKRHFLAVHVLRNKILVFFQCCMQESLFYMLWMVLSFQWIVPLDGFEINMTGWQDEKAIYQCWKQAWGLIKLFLYYYFERRLNTYLMLLAVHLPIFPLNWQVSRVLSNMTDRHENNDGMLPKYPVFC